MYFILKSANFPDTIGTIEVTEGNVGSGGSSDGSTPSTCTFTIKVTNPTSGATVTLTAAGYTQSGNSITVPSGTSVAWSVSASGYQTKTGTKIVSITSTQSVSLVAEGSSGGGGSEGDGETTGYTALPTTKKALGVTSSGTGRVSSNNAKRFSTADDTVANGILIPNGKTLHLIGLASGTYPLRLDYIYCTGNVTCPVSGSTTAIEGLVGTASNYDSNNYFPLNKTGADAIDITNNYGADYYFWFGFAGQTLQEGILAEYDTYTLKYKVD